MRPRGSMLPATVALASAAVLAPAVAGASTGHVVDPEGKPVQGARVCYMLGRGEGLCATTDENGFYRLPASELKVVRIQAAGFLVRKLSAVPQDEPVRLKRAASILIRLRDANTGAPVSGAAIMILRPTGKQLGPLPTEAAGAVEFLTLVPGEVRLAVKAEGYADMTSDPLILVGGERTDVDLELTPE